MVSISEKAMIKSTTDAEVRILVVLRVDVEVWK
jgi:hypothetical protein